MNKLALAAGVAVLAGVVAPYMAGSMARDQIKNRVDLLNDAGMGVVAQYNEVSTGIYSSVVNLAVGIDADQLAMQDLTPEQAMMFGALAQGDINVDLSHGPWLFGEHATFGLAEWNIGKTWPIPMADKSVSVTYAGALGLGNAIVGELAISPLEHKLNEMMSINFSGMTIGFDCSSSTCSVDGGMNYMFFHGGANQRVSVTKMVMAGTSDNDLVLAMQGGFYNADVSIDIESIDANGAFLMNNFGIDVVSTLDKDTDIGGAKVTYRADDATANGITVNDMVATVELANVLNGPLMELQKILRETPDPSVQNMGDFAAVIAPMLNEGVHTNIDELTFTIDNGTFTGTADFIAQSDQVNEATLANPAYWSSIFTGNANASIDMNLARTLASMQVRKQMAASGIDLDSPDADSQVERAVEMTLKQFMAMGFVVLEDDKLTLNLEKTADTMLLNGKPMPM